MSNENKQLATSWNNVSLTGLKKPQAAAGGMNGLPHGSMPLLPSLRKPRDLTLGGRNPSKPVFTPNLNVVRKKNVNVKTSKDTTITSRGGRGRGRGGGRGASHLNTSLIQMTGVFSEGVGGPRLVRKYESERADGKDTVSSMRRPTFNRNENKDVKVVIISDERENLDDSDDDFKNEKTDVDMMPIRLNPAKLNLSLKTEVKEQKASVGEATLNGDSDFGTAVARHIEGLPIPLTESVPPYRDIKIQYPRTVEEMLISPQQQLVMIQLPDILPCEKEIIDSDEEGDGKNEEKPFGGVPLDKSFKSKSIRQLPEGKIGKLVRYKSGKVKVVLGNNELDVQMGVEPGLKQDLVSLHPANADNEAQVINLGTLNAKLTVLPDWNKLCKL